ncbi:MAG: hypothetical protein HY678_02670 [Chloroflexi bacterium]|nr:hypothetical protein [Chloroflexota bacterium]
MATYPVSSNCPVTLPVPPDTVPKEAAEEILGGSSHPDPTQLSMYGNDAIWVVIPRDGVMRGVQRGDGIFDKFPTVRLVHDQLTAEGRRLDGPSPPPHFGIPDGYGTTGFQAFGVTFPTSGCWEITQRLDDKELRFVVRVAGPQVWIPLEKLLTTGGDTDS